MIIYSYRGLDGERREELPENSLEAYRWAFECGFGAATEVNGIELEPVLKLTQSAGTSPLALQVPYTANEADKISQLLSSLKQFRPLHSRLLLYGLSPRVAAEVRASYPEIQLAASVCHAFDVARYQSQCHNALLTLNDLLTHSELYQWAWLEEFDRIGGDGKSKSWFELCAADLHGLGKKIAVVSPELHAKDGHPDGLELSRVENRWRGILSCKPDAVCTTYPARLAWFAKS